MSFQTKKIVNFRAELITNDINHVGVIENLTRNTLYIRAVLLKPVLDFIPGKTVEIKFEPVEGELINLLCKVIWSYRTPPHGLTNSIGIEIIKRHPTYDKLMEIF